MTAEGAAAGSMTNVPVAKLVDHSIEVLLAGQAPTGAFVAAPDFQPYRYSWLRDGTFCAYALDLCGRHDEAASFYGWVGRTLTPLAGRVDDVIRRAGAGKEIPAGDFLPTRFSLEGDALDDGWPNFQLDGYGTWLWGLGEHVRLARDDRAWADLGAAVELTCRYLEAFATHACYDCWEEEGERVHPSTLACVYGGLAAAAQATGRVEARVVAEAVRSTVLERGVRDGVVRKSLGVDAVDASALWLSHPFGLLEPGDPATVSTVAEIEGGLRGIDGTGVRRYAADSYYGGGSWPLLTAWLGWHYALNGRIAQAGGCLEWIESQASSDGDIPEQVGGAERDPVRYEQWVRRWGPPTRQLLWSHAMYLVLANALTRGDHAPPADTVGKTSAATNVCSGGWEVV